MTLKPVAVQKKNNEGKIITKSHFSVQFHKRFYVLASTDMLHNKGIVGATNWQ